MFSILCGFTVGEYIRNRRLSLAGTELAASNAKIIDVALKYGYESPDSFTKVFLVNEIKFLLNYKNWFPHNCYSCYNE